MPRLKLRRLVTVLALASGIIAFVNTLYAAYLVQREQLIANTLEATSTSNPYSGNCSCQPSERLACWVRNPPWKTNSRASSIRATAS
jgi:hypothetical protein